LAFDSEQRIPNAVEPACGATKFLLRQPPRTRERKFAKSSAIWVLSLHAHLIFGLLLSVAQANERKLVRVCDR
jgi:hypothetical protein